MNLSTFPALATVMFCIQTLAGCAPVDVRIGEQAGTETGNPPALDATFIFLGSEPGHVAGLAGAATPGPVTIIDLRSGDIYHGTALADGSFDVAVPGAPDGLYSVVAGEVADLTEARLHGVRYPDAVITVGNGSVEDTLAELGLTCAAETIRAASVIDDAMELRPRQCEEDSDCLLSTIASECATGCGTYATSASGESYIDTLEEDLEHDICPAHTSGACQSSRPECPGDQADQADQADQPIAVCRFNRCSMQETQWLQQCGGHPVSITWQRPANTRQAPHVYTYSGMAYGGLERIDSDGERCVSTLAMCGSAGDETDIALRRAIAHDDVQRAIHPDSPIGTIVGNPAQANTTVVIEIDTTGLPSPAEISVHHCPSCDIPAGFRTLLKLLDDIETSQNPCSPD